MKLPQRPLTSSSRIRRQAPAPMALEQRYMFDGAAAGEALSKQPVAADAGLLHLAAAAQAPSAALAAAQQLAEKAVADFLGRPDAGSQLFGLFNGGQTAPSAAWSAAARQLLGDVQNGRYGVEVQLRSNLELRGAMGAFAAQGPDGRPVIYLNADWLAMGPGSTSIERVLVEELGHSLDAALNGRVDTAGDEGDAFAIRVLGETAADAARVGADDHATLLIDGASVEVEQASVTFKAVYAATPSAWSLQASSITLASQVDAQAGSIKFISADPAAPYFAGNNVAGNLVYSDSSGVVHSIGGVISRQFKTGSTTNAFYFYSTGADGLVGGADDLVYLVQVSADTTAYSGGSLVRTSSDPVASALNALLDTGLPSVSATTSYSFGALTAIESGTGAGRDGSGNVLDSHVATGSSLSVIAAGTGTATQAKVNSGTTAATGTSVTGQYGVLKIGADGSYSYAVTNSIAAVQALRTSGDTLAESFSYTVRDAGGNLVATTLTVTIQGQNDAPVAANDYGTAKATLLTDASAYTGSDLLGKLGTGNVLANDADVDRNGETKTIAGLVASGSLVSYTAGGSTTSLSFSAASTLNNVSAGYYVYMLSGGTYYELKNGTTPVTVTSTVKNADGTYAIQLSASPTNYTVGNGAGVAFDNSNVNSFTNTNGKKLATVSTATTVQTSTVTVGSVDGSVAVGMSVSGTNIPAGTKVSAVSISGGNTVVTLDHTLSGAPSGTLSFSAAAGTTVTGTYGSLALAADGSYTYTPFANAVAAGSSAVDSFKYAMLDAAGATSSATLAVTVLGSAASDPRAVDDTAAVTEDAASNIASGSVLGNDTTPSGSNTVVAGQTASASTATAIAAGSFVDLTGQYGTLRLYANGNYSYTLDNGNASVNALNSGASLTESFQYTLQNTAGGKSTASLNVTINGANDAPTLDLSPANVASTGFVTTYTQGDAGAAPLAGPTGLHVADADNGSYARLALTLTAAQFRDGSAEHLVINGASGANTSIANLGGLANGSGSFTLGGLAYGYTVSVSGGVATLSFSAAAAMTLAQMETLLTALRYENTSSNPYGGAGRVIGFTAYDANNLASNTATSTVVVYNTNAQPTAAPDTASATEAGGVANGTAGSNPSGSLIGNDSGSYIAVTAAEAGTTLDGSAAGVAASSTSGSNATTVAGSYGSLSVGADGSYRYVVDNANAAVQALNGGGTLTDSFSYQITDQNGQTATATLTVTVNGANDAPVAGAIGNRSMTEGQTQSFVAPAFSDVDNASLTYTATLADGSPLPAWVSFDPATRGFSFSPTAGEVGSYSFKLTGSDGALGAAATFSLTVAANGAGPAVMADAADATEAGGVANGTAGSNPGGQVLGNDTGASLTVSAVERGASLTGAATAVGGGSPTVIAGSYGSLSIAAGGSFSYTLDNSLSAVQALNAGDTLTDRFSYQARDGSGQTAATTLDITIHGANDAPTVPAAPVNQTATVGSAFSYTAPAFADVDSGDTVSYSASGLPAWASFDAATRQFTGTPSSASAAQTVTLTGTDSHGAAVSTSFTLAAVNAPSAPTIAISADRSALKAGETALLSFTLSAAPGSNPFALGDVSVSGGTLGSFQQVDATHFTAVFTPTAGSTASGVVGVAAAGFNDAGGTDSAASNTVTLGVDTQPPAAPGVTLTTDSGQSGSDRLSNDGRLTLSGVETGATVEYSRNGTSWSSSFTATEGANTVYVRQTDTAGNTGPASVAYSFTLDTQAPTISISADRAALKAGETALLSFTLSEAAGSNAFVLGDIAVSGGTLGSFQQVDATHFTARFTPATGSTASGVISVAAARFNDAAGNDAAASNTVTLVVDTQPPAAPGVALTTDSGQSGSDRLSSDGRLTLSGVETGATVEYSRNGTSWSSSFTATEGANTVYVRQTDTAGNTGPASAAYGFTLDTQAPTISVSADRTTLKAGETALLSFTLSEAAGSNAFALGDIAVSGGTLGSFQQVDATHFTARFTPAPNSQASGVINVAAAQFNDAAGNDATVSNTVTLGVNTQVPAAPAVALTTDSGQSGGDRLSKDGRLTLNGVAAGARVEYSLDGATWSTSFTATEGANTVYVRQTDAAGNVSPASAAYGFTLDTQAPTISVSADRAALKAGETALLSFTLSEAAGSNAFALGDIAVSGGTLGSFQQVDATHFTARFTPAPNSQASGVINVAAAQFNDAAGNDATASNTVTLAVDAQPPVAPVVALATDSGQSGGDRVSNDGRLTLAGIEPGATVEYSRDGQTWSASFTPMEGVNTVYVRQTDAAGNSGPASAPLSFTLDTRAPGITIGADRTTLKAGETALLTFTLSEAPGSNGFTLADVGVSGGTLSGFQQIDATTYTARLAPLAGSTASAVVGVAAARFNDVAGNDATASNTLSLGVDTQAPAAPVVSLAVDSGQGAADRVTRVPTLTLGGIEPGAVVEYSVDGIHWSRSFTAEEGANTVQVRQTDAAGNSGPASAPLSFTLDTRAPAIVIGADRTALKAGETAVLTFKLSEAPGSNGFTLADIAASGGTLSQFTAVDAATYTAVFTPAAASTALAAVQVAAARFDDAAGNDSTASNLLNLSVDTQAPAAPAVDALTSFDAQPMLTGRFPAADAAGGLQVSIGGRTYVLGVDAALTVQGDAWTLNLARAGQSLAAQTYDVAATVIDAAGNRSTAHGQAVIGVRPAPAEAPAAAAAEPVAPAPPAPAPAVAPAAAEPPAAAAPVADTRAPATVAALTDTLTANGSEAMRIQVVKADAPALVVFNGVPDQSFDSGSRIRFRLPPDAFMHTAETAVVRVRVERTDGGEMPAWLHFNATAGEFEGDVPLDAPQQIEIKVTARDDGGREASTLFRLKLKPGDTARQALPARIGLSQQIQQLSRQATLQRAAMPAEVKAVQPALS